MKITILLADDHQVVREGLRAILGLQPDLEVVGEAGNGHETVRLVARLSPDVVLLDVFMPGLNGIDAISQILSACATAKVLVLSSSDQHQHVETAIQKGACGYVLKSASGTDLTRAIREARSGKTFYSPSIAQRMQQRTRQSLPLGIGPVQAGRRLTPRQTQVLQLIAEGQRNKEMANALGLSIKTVEKHRQCLMNTLGIHQTAGLTRYALAMGIIERGVPPAKSDGVSRPRSPYVINEEHLHRPMFAEAIGCGSGSRR